MPLTDTNLPGVIPAPFGVDTTVNATPAVLQSSSNKRAPASCAASIYHPALFGQPAHPNSRQTVPNQQTSEEKAGVVQPTSCAALIRLSSATSHLAASRCSAARRRCSGEEMTSSALAAAANARFTALRRSACAPCSTHHLTVCHTWHVQGAVVLGVVVLFGLGPHATCHAQFCCIIYSWPGPKSV